MATRSYKTTNQRLDEVVELLTELIGWADADAEHAAENDAPATAKDDKVRGKLLRKARATIQMSYRDE